MQTSFTEEQLKNKENKSSEEILRKCVHCGMCNATCPTYEILGDELDGPRGRIYLIKDMLENNKPANKKITKQEVSKAHINIQKKIHPDISPETTRLSTIVNEAKDIILKNIS